MNEGMQTIKVVGLGPGPVEHLTMEASDLLKRSHKVFFRWSTHPVFHWAKQSGTNVLAFDSLYQMPGITFPEIYDTIVNTLIQEAKDSGTAVYAVPGCPFVFRANARVSLTESQESRRRSLRRTGNEFSRGRV